MHLEKQWLETRFSLQRLTGLKPGGFKLMGQQLDSTCTQPDHVEVVHGARHQGAAAQAADRVQGAPVAYTHLRAHETGRKIVCRLLLEKKKKKNKKKKKKKEKKKKKRKKKKKKRQQRDGQVEVRHTDGATKLHVTNITDR